MILLPHIKALFLNEVKFEFQNKQTLGGIFLYVFTSTFLAYLSFKTIESPKIWNGVFWIVLLFAAINTTMNSFRESTAQQTYLYSLVSPKEIIISKIAFNVVLLTVVALLCLGAYSLFLGNYISDFMLFFCTSIAGSAALACVLTLAAGIAYKASANGSLFSILSIPIVIPILILMITASMSSLKNKQFQSFLDAEMYANEEFVIRGQLIESEDKLHRFLDNDGKTRKLTLPSSSQLIPKGLYTLTGIYDASSNKYEISTINVSNKKDTFEAWIKVVSIMVINLLLIALSYVIFPKFWRE